MLFVIQSLTLLLVLLSFILVVTVPVSLATPGEWETSKEKFITLGRIWGGLVILIGFATVFS
jgi:photosystem II PsbZ protein|uniref:photosystem II protein Z n=1 Tax=Fibrocapsa japonica TaxID=94617 RepID=UPI002115531A|nr:photosystem II protein Z [Fibrocapsa japonica]UTE95205.1 photosystem II protein Z [Fibrocapsa japonica]